MHNRRVLPPRPGPRPGGSPFQTFAGSNMSYSELREGQRVRLVIDGTVEELKDPSVPRIHRLRVRTDGGTIAAQVLRRAAVSIERLKAAPSSWRAGDVVVIRYGLTSSTAYTYVRLADGTWSGNLTDAEADDRIDNGQGIWAMRDGAHVSESSKRPEAETSASILPF